MIAEALGSPAHAQGRPPGPCSACPACWIPPSARSTRCATSSRKFIVDGTRARTRFGIEPTPLDEAIAYTVAWLRTADRQ